MTMDAFEFTRMSIMDQWDYFWENTNDPLDFVSTTNFEYFLMKDTESNLLFELKVGKVGGMSLKIPMVSDLEKYRKNHKGCEKYPWD